MATGTVLTHYRERDDLVVVVAVVNEPPYTARIPLASLVGLTAPQRLAALRAAIKAVRDQWLADAAADPDLTGQTVPNL